MILKTSQRLTEEKVRKIAFKFYVSSNSNFYKSVLVTIVAAWKFAYLLKNYQ